MGGKKLIIGKGHKVKNCECAGVRTERVSIQDTRRQSRDRQTDARMGRAGKKDKEEKKYGKEIRREKNAQNVSVTGGKNANVKNSLHVSSWSISAVLLTVTYRQYMRVNGAEK